jgi:hypothetical protein
VITCADTATTNARCLTERLCNPRANCVDDELIRCIITVNDGGII